jgi:hypothetical protein
MGAEAGFDVSEVHVPLRLSGFLSLALGLLSGFSFLAIPLLLIPVLAILIGLLALRPSRQGRPVGTTAALMGILCAVGFGACGASVAWFKQATFGGQAEYFARQYFDVIARGEYELALELKKDFVNRFAADMPLKTFYANNVDSANAVIELKEDATTQEIQEAGSSELWVLTKAPRVYQKYGNDRVDLFFINPTNPKSRPIEVIMECKTDPRTNAAQWHVHSIQYLLKPIYAEAIL